MNISLLRVPVLAFALVSSIAAQAKPALTHDDYDRWPSIRSTAYSADGKWMAYAINPSWGDGILYVQEVDGERRYTHARGSSPRFSSNGRYVIFSESKSVVKKRKEDIAKLRGEKSSELEAAAKKEAAEKEKSAEKSRAERMARFAQGLPRGSRRPSGGSSAAGDGSIFIMDLQTGKEEKIEKTKGHRVVKDGEYLVYHMSKPEEKKATDKDKKPGAPKATEEKSAKPTTGEAGAARAGRGEARRRRGAGRRGGARSGSAASGRSSRSSGSRGSSSKNTEGTKLVVRDLATSKEVTYEAVASYRLVAKDKWLVLTCATNKKDSKVSSGLIAAPIAGGPSVTLLAGKGSFSGISTDPHFKTLAFTSDAVEQAEEAKKKAAEEAKKKVEEAKKKAAAGEKVAKATAATKAKDDDKDDGKDDDKRSRYDIYTWDFGAGPARMIVTNDTDGIPENYTISSGGLSWSGNGSVLSFSIRGESDPKLAKILPTEKVVVDIWHWNEGKIQPMQAKSRGRSSSKSRSCVWHVDAKRLVVLGDEAIPSPRVFSRDGSKAMGSDSKPYEKLVTWDGRYSDYYMVNTSNGKRTKIVGRTANRPSPSPSGRYLMHFGDDYKWYLIETAGMSKKRLTLGRHIQWENELEDRPQAARAYGVVGWTQGEEAVLINDRYDIWKFVIKTSKVTCVTNLFGRQNKIVLRYSKFDLEGDDEKIDADDRSYIPTNMWLSAKNERTRDSGYYIASAVEPGDPKKVVMSEDAIGGLARAKKAERIFFTLSDFDRYPDVWVAGMDFSNQRQLTDACPEQRAVRWGSSELINWTNSDGLALQGYLVKPEGFDPKKKYPMMVYFYERNAHKVHSYVRPTPGTSPNAAYYVSNGYLWFVPDIVYTVGYPGESAEKCVISGVQHLIAKGFVNKKAIGMAGHSWGGYQTAHLATRTNLFAAAESGAPVSNMFSAYGGIRYQSGMSRQFQYEKTQSRIGGTPWEYPQRYWQNSPVFYADRVQTPMLILHNDNDGAVPWTNGIEFFMALRRMGKEAYLFNYNGEPHGIRKDANKRDWARRMQEFFDHHLKGKPAVAWMTKGVPYADREKEKIQYARSVREAEATKKIKAVEATSGSRKAGKR